MAIKTLTNFKSKLTGGGARPNLFEANITFPSTALQAEGDENTTDSGIVDWNPGAQDEFQFLCKATSMPTQTIGSVDVPFRGRILKVAGDRTFEPWTVTVINDEDFNIRRSFEVWAQEINNLTTGVGQVDPNKYMGKGFVHQLSRSKAKGITDIADIDATNKRVHTYWIEEIWPSEIGSIDLSYESSDAIEEFTVTFQVQYTNSSTFNADGATQSLSSSQTTQNIQ